MTTVEPVAHTATNLLDLFDQRAIAHADRPLFRFLSISGEETSCLTFGATHERALAIAARLQAEGKVGAPVLLLFPPGPDFVCAFMGCVIAGAIAVPVYPPDAARLDLALPRLRSVVRTARVEMVLSDSTLFGRSEPIAAGIPELSGVPWLVTSELSRSDQGPWRRPTVSGRSLAMLQFTSGSTASPKGVMVTHGNLLTNLDQQATALELGDDMRAVCWLPFYHDLGLISGIFLTIYCGGETTFISPIDFVRRPLLWLQAISRYGANLAGGPDFSYALCVRRTRPEDRERLDLDAWRVAFIGAEPVRAGTITQFSAAFAGAGFRPETFAPGYGLAEATLLVTMTPPARAPVIIDFDTAGLEGGVASPVSEPSVRRTSLVSCGPPAPGIDLRIVDPPSGGALPEGRVGEVWVRGDNVAVGYWNSADTATFDRRLADGEPGFLRTGDLGFLAGGELYVTGREKDLIIIRGRNHSPADIEQTVESAHANVRPGGCAAFSIEGDDGEQLVVMAEANDASGLHDPDELAPVRDAVGKAITDRHGIAIRELVLIPPWTMPRTSSGKVQRHAARAGYLDDTLTTLTSLPRISGRTWPQQVARPAAQQQEGAT